MSLYRRVIYLKSIASREILKNIYNGVDGTPTVNISRKLSHKEIKNNVQETNCICFCPSSSFHWLCFLTTGSNHILIIRCLMYYFIFYIMFCIHLYVNHDFSPRVNITRQIQQNNNATRLTLIV